MENQAPQAFKFNFNKTVNIDTSFLQNSKQLQDEPKQNLKFTNSNQIRNEEIKLVQTEQNDVTNNQNQAEKIKEPNLFQMKANYQSFQPLKFNFNIIEYTKPNDLIGDQRQAGKIKEPNLFQLMINNCQPEIKQIDPHFLMNVHKIFPDLDLYLQIGLKTIAILDSQMKKLSETPIFGENMNGIQGDILKQNTQQYCTVMHQGIIYIQIFNDIYFVQNQSLQHLCQIPAINGIYQSSNDQSPSQRSQLFAINNQLYLSCLEQLYIYNNGKFKFVQEIVNYQVNQQPHDYFYQFGNNVFCLKSNQVFRVHANLQFTSILKTHIELEILCVQGGIIILSLLSQFLVIGEIIVINMLTDEVKHFKDVYGEQQALEIAHKINSSRAHYQKEKEQSNLLPTEIQQLFCLGEYGLQLNTEVQKQIFGEEFPEKCKDEFEKFMKSQMTQTYINEMVKFVKPIREDWKALEEKYAGMAVVDEQQEKYLHDCQLLNVMKLAPNLDVYMAVEDCNIHIINKEKKILHQIKVDFDYYVGKQFKVTQSNPLKTARFQNLIHNFVNNITFHNGSMYLQAFDKVYKIHNMKTESVATLPYLNLDYFKMYPQSLGSNSQHLVVNGDLEKQYILNNGKFKLNKYSSLQSYNFCGYCCDWDEIHQSITFRIENDEEKVKHILYNDYDYDDKLVQISFFSSGILILSSSAFETVYVLNSVTQHFKKLQRDTRFSNNSIYDNIELGVAGIQLKNEILTELFGQESILKIKEAYENYYFMNTNQYPELKNELNYYICLAKGQIPREHQTVELIQSQIDKPILQNSILQKCQLMNVVKIKSNYNIYLAIEDNNMYIIDDQRRIYGQYQVDYDMYAGIVQNYERGPSYAYQYNATICNGEIYVTKFDQVYKVHNQLLLFIAKIPCDSQCECILYSQNNQLFAINDGIQYQLINSNQFISIKNQYSINNWYYQFCDKLLLYEQEQKLQVQGHINYQKISGRFPSRLKIIVNQGGVVILKTNGRYQKQIYMINLISGQIESTENDALKDDQLWFDSIDVGGSGLQINDELINKIFNKPGDKPVSEQANEMYKSYLMDLEQNSQNWNEQIKQLLPFNVMLNYFENCESEQFKKINSTFLKVQEKVVTKLNYVKVKVTKITHKFSRVFASFTENNRIESTQ
ncbi:Conserved_hypothetical protein [Hexamita inflata]|uniref:Uncharacterized protein n=1 Tax=Hexamita inflata TaxID=28002 RepID=A0AA86TZF4_9EUKA|nr:Conserved hypothetical protein [Hexamita inflata]